MCPDHPERAVPAAALAEGSAPAAPVAPLAALPAADAPAALTAAALAVPAEADAPGESATDGPLKALLKEAVAEALREQRLLLQSIVEDALQELALAEATREVEVHERRYGRPAGFRSVDGEA